MDSRLFPPVDASSEEREGQCGTRDSVTGARCSRPPHSCEELHHDATDPDAEVQWTGMEKVRLWFPE